MLKTPAIACRCITSLTGRTSLAPTGSFPVTFRTSFLRGSRIESTKRLQSRSFAAVSMAQLKELRSMSGAPIVECKKALAESEDGDLQAAMDWLRQHGAAKASKKVSGREAQEGLVACSVSPDRKSASIVKVASETDFASKSPAFVGFVEHVAKATLATEQSSTVATYDSEAALALEVDSKSVQTALEEAIVAIRENLGISTATKLTTEDGFLVAYVHGKTETDSFAGTAAALVELTPTDSSVTTDSTVIQEAGKKLAMHIVAGKPSYLDPESIPDDILEKEREVLRAQIADSNKPPDVQEKIINGRIRKFYSDVCLTEQEHMVEEGNPKVSKALEKLGLKLQRFEAVSI